MNESIKLKWTPGPWVVGKGAGYYIRRPESRCAFVIGQCNRTSLVDGECDVEARANANLISAAPDLYEALAMVRDADDDRRMDGFLTIPQMARAKIDAALAKANGAKS